MSYFTANPQAADTNWLGFGFSGTSMCDARVAGEKLDQKMVGLSQEQQDKLWNKFVKKWGKIKPGTYEVYIVTPMVFGEQAALGQAFAVEGIEDTSFAPRRSGIYAARPGPTHCSVLLGLHGCSAT